MRMILLALLFMSLSGCMATLGLTPMTTAYIGEPESQVACGAFDSKDIQTVESPTGTMVILTCGNSGTTYSINYTKVWFENGKVINVAYFTTPNYNLDN